MYWIMLEKITFFKKIFDTVWEYHRDSGQLYVHHDSALPEYCNRQLPYGGRFSAICRILTRICLQKKS